MRRERRSSAMVPLSSATTSMTRDDGRCHGDVFQQLPVGITEVVRQACQAANIRRPRRLSQRDSPRPPPCVDFESLCPDASSIGPVMRINQFRDAEQLLQTAAPRQSAHNRSLPATASPAYPLQGVVNAAARRIARWRLLARQDRVAPGLRKSTSPTPLSPPGPAGLLPGQFVCARRARPACRAAARKASPAPSTAGAGPATAISQAPDTAAPRRDRAAGARRLRAARPDGRFPRGSWELRDPSAQACQVFDRLPIACKMFRLPQHRRFPGYPQPGQVSIIAASNCGRPTHSSMSSIRPKRQTNVETRPIGPAVVSGHFEFVEIGSVKLVRFDSSPQCYSRDARLVSKAGSDEFMFDFQRRGRSSMVQAGNESTIEPGYGVLYDARRPFEDRLDGPEQRSEVLIVTVPAASLLRTLPASRAAMRKTRAAVGRGGALDRGLHLQIHRCIGRPDRAERHGHGCLSVGAPAACVRQRSSAHPVKPVWPGRHISEGEHRRDPAGPGDCDRLRRFGADFSQDVW